MRLHPPVLHPPLLLHPAGFPFVDTPQLLQPIIKTVFNAIPGGGAIKFNLRKDDQQNRAQNYI